MGARVQPLISEFHKFLRSSSKNTEQFSTELLAAISVPTEFDELLYGAISAGRNTVISGTAGSGKTHLLHRVTRRIAAEGQMEVVEFGNSEPARGPFIRIVSDLTAIDEEELPRIFRRSSRCRAVVVAANEGALLAAAKSVDGKDGDQFRSAVGSLHLAQRGLTVPPNDGPLVLDAAGFDPATSGALAKLLALPVLSEVVQNFSPCSCSPLVCPRKRGWTALDHDAVRARVGAVVAAAAMAAEGFSFRRLWNLIGDLALGGSCEMTAGQVPTSPWYWRLYRGESDVAERVDEAAPAHIIPMPRAEGHLWYGDWNGLVSIGLLSNQLLRVFQPLPKPPAAIPDERLARDAHDWLKIQMAFLSERDFLRLARTYSSSSSLWDSVVEGDTAALIESLNRYMSYGFLVSSNELELWVDYAMERRSERPSGQISLGRARREDFAITRSSAAANAPSDIKAPTGSRLFLAYRSGSQDAVSLPLTRELVTAIERGRSARTVDRLHTEISWQLMRFFGELARTCGSRDRLNALLIDFGRREHEVVTLEIQQSPPAVRVR